MKNKLEKFKKLLKIQLEKTIKVSLMIWKKLMETFKLKLRNFSKEFFNLTKKHMGSLKKYIIAKKLKIVISTTIVIVITILSIGTYQAGNGYKVTFNGQDIGLVKSEENFQLVLDQVCDEVTRSKGEEINFDKNCSFEKVRIEKNSLLNEENIKTAIYQNINYKVMAAVIKVNGEDVAVLESKKEAEKILEAIKAPYTDTKDNVVIKEISFSDNVEIIEEEVSLERISSSEDALAYLQQGTDEIESYEVVSGDTSWDISREFSIGMRDMEVANPNVDLEDLHPGDTIKLTIAKPFIDVETIQEVEYTEQIPYETTYKDDKSIYKGKQKVLTSGKYGTKEIKAEVIYTNGIETARKILEEKVIKKPTTQIIVKGTKPLPPAQGSGAFRRPASGRTGSYGRFGASRPGGRRHSGVDIGNKSGTPIYAADGGTVTSYIGYRSGYGYVVEINHGAGYSTRYAHLSKILVSSGQRVAKGDQIGKMGSTGNSSGPHLHFEIRKNGTPLNPFKYIK